LHGNYAGLPVSLSRALARNRPKTQDSRETRLGTKEAYAPVEDRLILSESFLALAMAAIIRALQRADRNSRQSCS